MKGLLLFTLCAVVFGSIHCTTPEGKTIEAVEANARISVAMGIKNSQCGVFQILTFPAIFPVQETSVDLCVAAIVATSCTTWALTNPMPVACLGMPFYKRQSRENYGF